METLLILGSNGLIGSFLLKTDVLRTYHRIGVQRSFADDANIYEWNPKAGMFPNELLSENCHIINFAGANIASERWTKKRKTEIIDSRLKANEVLHRALSKFNGKVRSIVSISAIGYYGAYSGMAERVEDSENGRDFLGDVCAKWEESSKYLRGFANSFYVLRLGAVLAASGGIVRKIATPVSRFFGQPLGSGKQMIPWVAIGDVAHLIKFLLEQKITSGVYNVVAGNATNAQFMKGICQALKRPYWSVSIPSVLPFVVLGELASMLLEGSPVSSEKLVRSGFQFRNTDLELSLSEILKGF